MVGYSSSCTPPAEAVSLVRLVRTTFQRVVGLILRLQRQSEDETIGPGVPRKLAFALRLPVSRNRSRSFAGGSGAQRGLMRLHRHPRILIPQVLPHIASSPARAKNQAMPHIACCRPSPPCTCTSDLLFAVA